MGVQVSHGRVAIQWVRMRYDKHDRGADAGALRHGVPREYPFIPPGDSARGWLHEVRVASDDGYAHRADWLDLTGCDARSLPVAVQQDGETAAIRVVQHGGKIVRREFDGEVARLPFGRRLTIRHNNAYDGDHQRIYVEDALHIGWAAEATLDLPTFRMIDLRQLLY